MRQPVPPEARRDGRRTAVLSTVTETLDLAVETMREHGIAAAVTQIGDAAWEVRVDDRTVLTVCAPAGAPAASPVMVRADGVSAWAGVALASGAIGLQCSVESLSVEEFMRHLGVSRHEAQRIREKVLEDGL